MKILPKKPVVLLIFDGWGYSEKMEYNAIKAAHTPHWDHLWSTYPHTLLKASGESVGVPEGQMGNSEVGHLHMGAGRPVPQSLLRINQAIAKGEFNQNAVLLKAIESAKDHALHLMGLLSPGGVHSHESHIIALANLAAKQGLRELYFHLFLDGRDTPPRSAKASIEVLENHLKKIGVGKIASISGRYYAMDRDKRWERTQKVYDLLTQNNAAFYANSSLEALEQAYARGENDEFVKPTLIEKVKLQDQDGVVFMNFRADRARQLSYALTDANFSGFKRACFPKLSTFVTLTEYAKNLNAHVAFPPIELVNTLGEYVARQGKTQLRIAETEKYAHVTFFINGGKEQAFQGEERILIPSPDVATYDLQPEMSAMELTHHLTKAIETRRYDLIICNYANPDMVGHTGDFGAAVKAVEVVDVCLGRWVHALNSVGGVALITADHGNVECMFDEENTQSHTAHTLNPVPLICTDLSLKFQSIQGALYDIAPTLLFLMGLSAPAEMTGQNLFEVKGL